MDIQSSYDSVAERYAEHLLRELEQKPLDRHLLNRFAEMVAGSGLVADLGCGPGHVTAYLSERGVDVCGVDLAPGMILCAQRHSPNLKFLVGDMKALQFGDAELAGIVAFYAIVHFDSAELDIVFRECRRVLRSGGSMLLSFHIGTDVVHVEDMWGAPVSLDFRFHLTADIVRMLGAAGFRVTEVSEREPYADVEFPSRRCYLLARAG